MNKANPSSPINKAKNSIAKGEIKEALKQLYKISEVSDETITPHIEEFKKFEEENNKGLISREEYSKKRNGITHDLLELLDSIPESDSGTESPKRVIQKAKKKVRTPNAIALERIQEVKSTQNDSLDLSNLGLKVIPREINELDRLVELNLEKNQISRIEHLDAMVSLRKLNLGENQISSIENLESLVNLRDLDLGANYIEKIQNLDALQNLEKLNLIANEIGSIENLDHLGSLKDLILSSNPVSQIQNISHLKQLESLELDNCEILKIENLNGLLELQWLYLGENFIEKIENVSSLKKLRGLFLKYNEIIEISGIYSLKNLQALELSKNEISFNSLANSTKFFSFLKTRNKQFELYIDGNLFLDEIKSLKKSDYPENENHYATFLKDEPIITQKEQTVEITLPHKLVLLGNSNAGKSSLVDFLRTGKLQDSSPKKSTEVLDIAAWKPENKPEFLIYDFGGQDYYHATYQMFFSEEASYILLWSKDSNQNFFNREKTDLRPEEYYCFDVNYWLGNIQYLNDTVNPNTGDQQKSKGWYKNLILVENKIDALFSNPKPLKADERFGQIEQFRISLWEPTDQPIFETRRKWLKDFLQSLHQTTSEETQERKDAIQDYLKEWPQLKTKKNEWRFHELKNYLQQKFPSWKKLDNADFERILYRFSVSGLVIWYRYSTKLKNRVWVDPNQLQAPILELLNHKNLKVFEGKIPLKDFNELPEFEHYRDLLMQKQIITYDEHDQIYIVPQKLKLNPEEDPLYQIAVQGLQSSFTIKFKNFMPLGIMNRLIRMFGKISDKKYYSRYEMVFSLDPDEVSHSLGDEKVLLQCDMELLTLTVSTTNDTEDLWKDIFKRILWAYHRKEERPNDSENTPMLQRNALAQNSNISNSHMGPSQMDFEELIPNDLQIALSDGYFVDYAEIQKAVNANLKKVQAHKSDEEFKEVRVYHYSPFFYKEIKKPKKVFISYSHDDLSFRKELQKYLINMERDNLIEVWQDGMIQPGTEWDLVIKENLEKADIIILLVSQSFIASNYIHEVELRKTMEKQLNGTARFFPILIKNCDYLSWKALPQKVIDNLEQVEGKGVKEKVSLASFQFLPQNKTEQRLQPINSWKHPEDAWVEVNNKIRAYVSS